MVSPNSFIFRTIVRILFFLINILAIYLLLRGHDAPGGGFIGGLAAAIALVLLGLAVGLEEIHRVLRFDPVRVASAGLTLSVVTGAVPMMFGRPFLEHFHFHVSGVPVLGELHIGTPLAFDVGVYLVVVGVTCKVIFVLAKSTAGMRALVAAEEARYSSIRETPIEEQPAEDVDESEDPFRDRQGAADAS
jgi:multisubunit Na+/H+ antiporter MnhB subunit